MSICPKKDWFVKWFDSPYYHLLYQNRDAREAELFIENLLKTIALPPDSEILDLACGKGRHALFLRSKGFRVTGIDLSPESITEAKNYEDENLRFMVADMRNFSLNKRFSAIMNLFTSFGYFQDIAENNLVIRNVKEHLLPGGYFVLDYFNATCVESHLPFSTRIEREGVEFAIRKYAEDGFVVKEINITDGSRSEFFMERVQLLTRESICNMLDEAGFRVIGCYGNYQLSAFNESDSDRMIIIAQN
jgi:SAM-dependent methyltransferase